MRTRLIVELALVAACVGLRPPAAAAQGGKCSSLSGLQVPGFALAITRAEAVPAGPAASGRGRGAAVNLPAHCRVEGTIDRRTGAEGKPYGIGFAVALARRLERPLSVSGRGRAERHRRPSARRAGRGRFAGARPGLRRREHRHGPSDLGRRVRRGVHARSAGAARFRVRGGGTRRRPRQRRSSRATTDGPRTIRTSQAARRAGAKPC